MGTFEVIFFKHFRILLFGNIDTLNVEVVSKCPRSKHNFSHFYNKIISWTDKDFK